MHRRLDKGDNSEKNLNHLELFAKALEKRAPESVKTEISNIHIMWGFSCFDKCKH